MPAMTAITLISHDPGPLFAKSLKNLPMLLLYKPPLFIKGNPHNK
jgi:hypothetical protein